MQELEMVLNKSISSELIFENSVWVFSIWKSFSLWLYRTIQSVFFMFIVFMVPREATLCYNNMVYFCL